MRTALWAAIVAALVAGTASAGVIEVNPETFAAALEKANPGDVFMLADGVYKGDMKLTRSGEGGSPIWIGATGGKVIFSGGDACLWLDGVSWVTVDGIVFRNAATAGIKVRGGERGKGPAEHITVRKCTFANNRKWGIATSHVDYVAIEDCEAFGATAEHGICVANSGSDAVIRGNRIHDNAGNGITITGDPGTGEGGTASRALVENNRIWENGKGGGAALSIMQVQDSLFRNNLLYDNYSSGIALFLYTGKEDERGSKDNRIYHNTVYFRPGEGRLSLLLRRAATGNNIRNNVFLGGRLGVIYAEPSCLSGMKCDYNVVANYDGQRLFGDGAAEPTPALVKEFAKQGITVETSAGVTIPTQDWRLRGLDMNSLVEGIPEFVDAGKGDFHLAKGSAGIGAGTPISDVATDIDGTPRPKTGRVDCGCYQTKAE